MTPEEWLNANLPPTQALPLAKLYRTHRSHPIQSPASSFKPARPLLPLFDESTASAYHFDER
jgi:hypothetical protein